MPQADDGRPPVEKARPSDIPDLVELMRQFYAESSCPLDRAWAAASFGRLLDDENRGAAWLALREGAIRVEVGPDNPAARALYRGFGLASRGHELLAGPVP